MRNSDVVFVQAPFGNESTSTIWKQFRSYFKSGNEISRQVHKKSKYFVLLCTKSICDMVACRLSRNYSVTQDIMSYINSLYTKLTLLLLQNKFL